MMQKRKVRFNEKATVCMLKRPTQDEVKKLWYTKKELKSIRSGIKREIKSLSEPGRSADNNSSFHWRGLERVRTGTMSLMLDSQRALVRGVISMQQMHKMLGLKDDRAFNLFVVGFSKEATKRANIVAKRDFIDALQIYREL